MSLTNARVIVRTSTDSLPVTILKFKSVLNNSIVNEGVATFNALWSQCVDYEA